MRTAAEKKESRLVISELNCMKVIGSDGQNIIVTSSFYLGEGAVQLKLVLDLVTSSFFFFPCCSGLASLPVCWEMRWLLSESFPSSFYIGQGAMKLCFKPFDILVTYPYMQ